MVIRIEGSKRLYVLPPGLKWRLTSGSQDTNPREANENAKPTQRRGTYIALVQIRSGTNMATPIVSPGPQRHEKRKTVI